MNIKNINTLAIIEDTIMSKPDLKPIYINDIYNEINMKIPKLTKPTFNTYMTRLMERNQTLKRYKKGIYYKTVNTPFGDAKIDKYNLIRDKYLYSNNKVIGYETGPTIMQKVGLTTQIPKLTYITSNIVKNNRREKAKDLYLLKPKIKITKENFKYLQMLDIIENRFQINIELDNLKDYYKELINKFNIDIVKLIVLATEYNNIHLVNYVAQLLKEVKQNEITFK